MLFDLQILSDYQHSFHFLSHSYQRRKGIYKDSIDSYTDQHIQKECSSFKKSIMKDSRSLILRKLLEV
jgi:hypothetical protein